MIICCAGCDKPIMDKFLLTVLERTWHAECVRCVDCGCALTDKCFSREGKLFCRSDFFRRFGTKCSGCLQGISPQDLVRKARDRVFHLKCFTCCVCRKQLSTGEELYVLDENKFICKQDYMGGKALTDSFPGGSDDEEEESMDVKPTLETNNNTSTPPVGGHGPISAPNPSGLVPSPSGPNTPTGGAGLSVAMMSGGRPSTPTRSIVPPTSTTPLLEPMSVGEPKINTPFAGFNVSISRDTPPTDKDGGNFHDSDVSDTEGSSEVKEPASGAEAKLEDEKVWFQNKRSKERRMKQLSSMGMRAHLFGSPRKLRGMRMSPSMEDGFPYYGDAFGYGPQGFHDFFPGQGPPPPPGMGFPHGLPPSMEQPPPPGGPMSDFPGLGGLVAPPVSEGGHFMTQPPDMLSLSQRSSPEGMIMAHGGQSGNFDHQVNEGLVW